MVDSARKQPVNVEVLHLDDGGYGPSGTMTRREWRTECRRAFEAGEASFEEWQEGLPDDTANGVPFGMAFRFDDGKFETAGDGQLLPATTLDFAGATFEHECSFEKFAFLEAVIFTGAAFWGDAAFDGAVFQRDAFFDRVSFKGLASFQHARFEAKASFGEADFWNDASFNHARLGTATVFDKAMFHRQVRFWRCIFGDETGFDSGSFAEAPYFANAVFSGVARFHCVTFERGANFRSVTISRVARFDHAVFLGPALFSDEPYGGPEDSYFGHASFVKDAYFVGTRFAKEATFKGVTFQSNARFSSAVFEGRCRFQGARFDKSADFESVEFSTVGHFEKARFLTRSPSFLGVAQQTTLIFRGTFFPDGDVSTNAIEHYMALKQLSEAVGHHEQALNFNALELEARRAQPIEQTWTVFWFVTGGYRIFSDYGRSFLRPLVTYVVLVLFTYSLALMAANENLPCPRSYLSSNWACELPGTAEHPALSGYRAAYEYVSFRGAGVLDLADTDKYSQVVNKRLFGTLIEPFWMRTWGLFKAIAGLTLLFLAALGLRNRFRLG